MFVINASNELKSNESIITNISMNLISKIAYMMFNSEMGKSIFDHNGNIDRPDVDNNVITYEGVKYTIQNSTGHIVFLLPNGVTLGDKKSIRENINQCINDIYNRYQEQFGIPYLYNKNSTDFINIYTKTPAVMISRYIGDTCRYNSKVSNSDSRIWYDDRTCLCIDANICVKLSSRFDTNNADLMENRYWDLLNSIVVDFNDTFTSTDTITKFNELSCLNNYKMSKKFVTFELIKISTNTLCPIDGILREMFNVCKNEEYVMNEILTPIYEEDWKNIKPIRLPTDLDSKNKIIKLVDSFKISTQSYEVLELEEIRDKKTGAPERSNDKCHICYMLLYDSIYAIEYDNKHICVCASCLHIHIKEVEERMNKFISKKKYGYNILKTIYPRTCCDLINSSNLETNHKKLLCSLSIYPNSIENNIIYLDSYIGLLNIHDALYNKLNIDHTNKQFFNYILI